MHWSAQYGERTPFTFGATALDIDQELPDVDGLLQGRRALITGGTRGLGAATAQRLAELGANGIVVDLAEALPGNSSGWDALPVDVRDEAGMRDVVSDAAERLGGLDLVVAAAGVVPAWQSLGELDLNDFDRVMSTNVLGVITTVKHTAPFLGEGATITAIGSLNSWKGDPNIPAYVASKHAVLGLVRSAALALGPSGVRVNAVGPGPIATEALLGRVKSRSSKLGATPEQILSDLAKTTALGRIATEQEVADVIAFLSSPMSSGITGQLINIDSGVL